MSVIDTAEKVVDVVEELIPPPNDSKRAARRWRIMISLATCSTAFGVALHIALACGFAAPFYPGFASASEITAVHAQVQNVIDEMKQQRIGVLEASILDAKKKHCEAAPAVKELYLGALIKMLAEYQKLTTLAYPDIACSSFK